MSTIAEPSLAGKVRPIARELLDGDLIQPGHPLFGIVWINPERLSGAPCFYGTRVPLANLFDYLAGGQPLGDFLEGFPGVTREQAIAVLEFARTQMLTALRTSVLRQIPVPHADEVEDGIEADG